MGPRIFSDMFNGNLNISGGFGLFKKEAVEEIGGYDGQSVGEDMDLVLRLHKAYLSTGRPYKMRYSPYAVCWTQAPMTLKDLGRQRARWHRGLIQSMWAHREFFLNFRYGAVSLISFMYYFLYEFLSPLIEVLGFFIIILALLTQSLNFPVVAALTATYITFNILSNLTLYVSNFLLGEFDQRIGNSWKVVWISLMEALFFKPYLFLVRVYATLTYRSRLHSWSKIERESFEEAPK